jgi:hypothetical protein
LKAVKGSKAKAMVGELSNPNNKLNDTDAVHIYIISQKKKEKKKRSICVEKSA